jgi:hypothetical protein
VLALSGMALLLRVVVAQRGGLWRDEALFLFVVRSDSWSSMVDLLRMHESHPPGADDAGDAGGRSPPGCRE